MEVSPMTVPIRSGIALLAFAIAAAVAPAGAAGKPQVSAGDIASLVQPQAAQSVTMSLYATGL